MTRLWRIALPVFVLSAFAWTALPIDLAQAADDDDQPVEQEDGDKKEGQALQDIRRLLEKNQFEPALTLLAPYTDANPKDPNGWNLRGYASRKSGNFSNAHQYYDRALALAPNHKGALEYLGELYVQMGKPESAKILLAKLNKLCPEGCDEATDLAAFISGKHETAATGKGAYGKKSSGW